MYRITVFNQFVLLRGKLGAPRPEGFECWYITQNHVQVEVKNGVVTAHKDFEVWTGVLNLVDSFKLDELSYKEFKVWKETYNENKKAIEGFLKNECQWEASLEELPFEEFVERKLPENWREKLVLRTIEELQEEYRKMI